MKRKTIAGIAGIAVTWILINFYMYYTKPKTKPDIKPEKSKQKALKEYMDGHVLSQSEQEMYEELTNRESLTLLDCENKLLELLNEKIVWIVKDFHNTEDRIKQKLEEEKVNIKIIGWTVRRVDEQTCLVSYTYEKGSKTLGWFFDVKSGGKIISDVSSDPELMKKYNVDYREEAKKKFREEKDLRPAMSKLDEFKRLQGKGSHEKWLENEKKILMLRWD